jgi:hypothetical protein
VWPRPLPPIRDFAPAVFSCAATTAASERNFFSHMFVHSRLRNRLKNDRVEKLVHVFFNEGDTDPTLHFSTGSARRTRSPATMSPSVILIPSTTRW